MERVELGIFNHKNIADIELLIKDYIIANIYIKVDLSNISETRKKLIDLKYTTRLFVTLENGKKSEYIFGKLKGSKGVFNEHCKNSFIHGNINNVIIISSNDLDTVMIDDNNIKNNKDREWKII